MRKFTIITPSYNQGDHLEKTILSVIEQDYPLVEYLVIDGGSTDHSVDIIKKYEDRIDFWISEPDRGQSHAINKGLERATGEIISWINSDDQLLPGALTRAAQYFEQDPSLYLLHGKSIIQGPDAEFTKGAIMQDIEARLLAGLPYPQPASFFLRKIFDEFGPLEENLHFGMDYDLLMRVHLNYKVLGVPDIFSRYLLHDQSKSTLQNKSFAVDWAAVYCKFLRSVQPLPKTYIDTLKKLRLYQDGASSYPCRKNITDDLLESSFAYFLVNQVIFYFHSHHYRASNGLFKFIKVNYPEIYRQENLARTHFLSKPVINLYKRITSKLR
jgi:glycosyltransferase involved in cell wall biosynthesis